MKCFSLSTAKSQAVIVVKGKYKGVGCVHEEMKSQYMHLYKSEMSRLLVPTHAVATPRGSAPTI